MTDIRERAARKSTNDDDDDDDLVPFRSEGRLLAVPRERDDLRRGECFAYAPSANICLNINNISLAGRARGYANLCREGPPGVQATLAPDDSLSRIPPFLPLMSLILRNIPRQIAELFSYLFARFLACFQRFLRAVRDGEHDFL